MPSDTGKAAIFSLESLPEQFDNKVKDQFDKNLVVPLSYLLPDHMKTMEPTRAGTLLLNADQKCPSDAVSARDGLEALDAVGQVVIGADDDVIRRIFEQDSVRGFLGGRSSEELYLCPYGPDEYAIRSPAKPDEAKGWRFDDYTFALVWVIDTPDQSNAGKVEYVNFKDWQRESSGEQLCELLSTRQVRSLYIPAGACYLMRRSTAGPRVTPPAEGSKRTVIVHTHASDHDLRDDPISQIRSGFIYEDRPVHRSRQPVAAGNA